MTFQGVLNDKLPLIADVFDSANKSENPVEVLQSAAKKDGRLHVIIGYLINPKFKMGLPEGDPPYIPGDFPSGLSELDVLRLEKKMYILYQSETRRMKKEEIFIQWLEQMTPTEAKILIAIKDKNLDSLYPNLTEKVLVDFMQWDFNEYSALKAKG